MKRATVAACVLVFLAVSGSRAFAAPIQPPVWSGNGANVGISWTSSTAQGSGFVTFDTFSYAADTSIGQATWYGIFLNDPALTDGAATNTSRWDVLIFDNSGPGGTPNNLIGGDLGANVQRTTLGTG